jgi:Tfp pilus assembly protein PilO
MAVASRGKIRIWLAEHLAIAGGAVFAVALLLGYLFVFAPMLRSIKALNRTAALALELDAKEDYLKKLETLKKNFEAFDAEDIARIRTMVPPEEDVPGLMAILEAAAADSDVALTAMNFSKGDKSGAIASIEGLDVINVALSVEHADYLRFKLFLESLEGNLRLFDVRSVSLSPGGASYSMILRTYVQSKPLL